MHFVRCMPLSTRSLHQRYVQLKLLSKSKTLFFITIWISNSNFKQSDSSPVANGAAARASTWAQSRSSRQPGRTRCAVWITASASPALVCPARCLLTCPPRLTGRWFPCPSPWYPMLWRSIGKSVLECKRLRKYDYSIHLRVKLIVLRKGKYLCSFILPLS